VIIWKRATWSGSTWPEHACWSHPASGLIPAKPSSLPYCSLQVNPVSIFSLKVLFVKYHAVVVGILSAWPVSVMVEGKSWQLLLTRKNGSVRTRWTFDTDPTAFLLTETQDYRFWYFDLLCVLLHITKILKVIPHFVRVPIRSRFKGIAWCFLAAMAHCNMLNRPNNYRPNNYRPTAMNSARKWWTGTQILGISPTAGNGIRVSGLHQNYFHHQVNLFVLLSLRGFKFFS
jgi:hypothetical protein